MPLCILFTAVYILPSLPRLLSACNTWEASIEGEIWDGHVCRMDIWVDVLLITE